MTREDRDLKPDFDRQAEELESQAATGDLFAPERRADDLPSDSVYCDLGLTELFYVGEVQLPKPIPVELVVEVQGWDYYYKLDRREKSSQPIDSDREPNEPATDK